MRECGTDHIEASKINSQKDMTALKPIFTRFRGGAVLQGGLTRGSCKINPKEISLKWVVGGLMIVQVIVRIERPKNIIQNFNILRFYHSC